MDSTDLLAYAFLTWILLDEVIWKNRTNILYRLSDHTNLAQ